tara:strand:+ start:3936 stop:4487 length:552 start_codon:yes stop_codon:yes gene_type:complete
MEIAQAIKKRRTIHSFSRRTVPREIIQRSIEAANYAPCHRMTFPWRFTSLGLIQRQLLVQLQAKIKFDDKTVDEKKLENIRVKMLNPSHLLVASQVLTSNKVQKSEDYAACACAIQNLALSLVAEGVGSKWSTGKIIKDSRTYKIAKINPNEEEIIGFIWVGYGDIPSPIARPITSKIFREYG